MLTGCVLLNALVRNQGNLRVLSPFLKPSCNPADTSLGSGIAGIQQRMWRRWHALARIGAKCALWLRPPGLEEGCQAGMHEEMGTKSAGDKEGTFAACRFGLFISESAHKAARPKMGSASQFGKAGALS